jgi:hypothetical protein
MHKDEKNLLKEVLDKIAKLEGKNGEAFESGIKELVQIGAKLEASAKKKGDVAGENLGQKIQEQAKQKLFEEKGIGLSGQEDTAGNRISQALLGKNSPTGIKEGHTFNKETNTYHKTNEDGTQGAAVDKKVAKQSFGERVGATFKGIGASIKEGASAENLFDKGSLARSVFVPQARERELENQQLEKESKKGEMADIAKDAKGIIDGETPTKKDKKEKSKSDKSASGTGDPSKPIEKLIVAIEKLIVAMDKKDGEKTPGKAEKQKDPTAVDKVDAERKDVGKTADRLKAGVNGEEPKSLQPRNTKGRFAKKEPTPVNVVKTPGPSTSDKQNADEARQAEEIKEKTGDTKGILAAESIDAKDPSSGSMLAGAGAAAEEAGAGGDGALGFGALGAAALAARALLKKKTPAPDAKPKPPAKLPKGINEKQLLDKNGKPLSGAARNSRIEKLQKAKPAGKPGMFEKIRKGGPSPLSTASKGVKGLGRRALGAAGMIGFEALDYATGEKEVNARNLTKSGGALTAAYAGAAFGATLMAPLAPFTFGAAPVLGGLIGGVGGYFGGEKLAEMGYDAVNSPKKVPAPQTGANTSSRRVGQATAAAAPRPPAVIQAPQAQPAAVAQQKNGVPPIIMEKQGVRMNDNSWERFQDRRAIG